MTHSTEDSRPLGRSAREMAAPGVHDAVLALIPPPPKRVLELGSGEGALAIRLANMGYDVIACDLQLPRIPNIQSLCVNLESRFPFRSHSFDIVTMVEVVEHLENPSEAIRQAVDALKSEGTIIITTPNIQNFLTRAHFLKSGLYGRWFKTEDLLGSDRRRGTDHITPIHPLSLHRMLVKAGAAVRHVSTNRVVSVRQLNSWWSLIAKPLEIFAPLLMTPKDANVLTGDILVVKAERVQG